MLDDLRAAVRSVARRRGLAATVVLTLGLGIGANSAIFSAIDSVLLKPLPYPASDRLMAVYEANASQKQLTSLVAPVRLEEWNGRNRSFFLVRTDPACPAAFGAIREAMRELEPQRAVY